MKLPELPPLGKNEFMGLSLTEDSFTYTAQEVRAYATTYAEAAVKAEREACAANVDAMSELFIAAAELDRLQARVAELEKALTDIASMSRQATKGPAHVAKLTLSMMADVADAAIDTARKAKP